MISGQINVRWWFTLNGTIRHSMVRGIPGFGPPKIVLTEYPKSGGTWISQMVSDYLGVPYARHRLPPRDRCLIHGHYLHVDDTNDIIVVWRDGRDAMTSYYYRVLFEGPMRLPGLADAYRRKLGIDDADDVERYLPRFMEHCFTKGLPHGSWVRFGTITWTSFADAWKNRKGYVATSYEAMTENPRSALTKILRALVPGEIDDAKLESCISKFSFENVAKRKRGIEDPRNILRKGIVGDWKNKFTREAREIFCHYAGQTLIDLGYESDQSWVDQCHEGNIPGNHGSTGSNRTARVTMMQRQGIRESPPPRA